MEKKSVPLELILEAQEALKKSPLIHSPLLLLNLNVPGKRVRALVYFSFHMPLPFLHTTHVAAELHPSHTAYIL